MNTNRVAPRLLSIALAACVTLTLLAGIDTLAHTEHAARALMAQAASQPGRPS